MCTRTVGVALSFWLGVLGMVGCGGSAPSVGPASTATDVASHLNGNWLLAGSLPVSTVTIGAPVPFGLAMSFTVNGNEILGAGVAKYSCSGVTSEISLGALVRGTIGTDGSFTAQTPSGSGVLQPPMLTVTGVAPKTAQGAWSGTYTLQSTSPSLLANPCTFSQAASFTATPIANVSGKYVGSGTLAGSLGQPATPVTVSVELQQGSTLTSAAGVANFDALALTGTMQVTGVPCFTSGSIGSFNATSTTGPGTMEGNQVEALFVMNDGSKLLLDGSLPDVTGTRIVQPFFLLTSGSCGGTGLVLRVTELDKVS